MILFYIGRVGYIRRRCCVKLHGVTDKLVKLSCVVSTADSETRALTADITQREENTIKMRVEFLNECVWSVV
jgi:hypothetical protein